MYDREQQTATKIASCIGRLRRPSTISNFSSETSKTITTNAGFRIRSVTHMIKKYREDGWLVGCFGFNGPLRQYFSLYPAVSQRGKTEKNDRRE